MRLPDYNFTSVAGLFWLLCTNKGGLLLDLQGGLLLDLRLKPTELSSINRAIVYLQPGEQNLRLIHSLGRLPKEKQRTEKSR
jgi:hypothetical protein